MKRWDNLLLASPLDATCAPSDISYPTDLGLLNQGRKHTEKIIDYLYEQVKEKIGRKPRTYRNIARKNYGKIAKKRRPRQKQRRNAIKKQLQYIRRNLSHIKKLIKVGATLSNLGLAEKVIKKRDGDLLVIQGRAKNKFLFTKINKT